MGILGTTQHERLLALRHISGCFYQVTRNVKKKTGSKNFVSHQCGQRLVDIQRDKTAALGRAIYIAAIGAQALKNIGSVGLGRNHYSGFTSRYSGRSKIREALDTSRIIRAELNLVADEQV